MGKSTRMIPESHFWNFVLQLNDLYKCWVWIFSYREKKTASRFDLYISRYKACNQCHFDAKTACFKRHFSISCFSYIFAYGLHNSSCMIRLRPYLLKNATTNDLKLLVFKIFPIFSTKIDLCVTLQNITQSFFLSIFFIRFTWNSISRGFKHWQDLKHFCLWSRIVTLLTRSLCITLRSVTHINSEHHFFFFKGK